MSSPYLESCGTASSKRRARLGNTVGEGELEVGDEELLDVGTADVIGLLDLHHAENLCTSVNRLSRKWV